MQKLKTKRIISFDSTVLTLLSSVLNIRKLTRLTIFYFFSTANAVANQVYQVIVHDRYFYLYITHGKDRLWLWLFKIYLKIIAFTQ